MLLESQLRGEGPHVARPLVAAMAKCDCEAYLWFVHNDALEAKVRDTSINGDGVSGIFSWLRL